jgi:predicted AAA+ superfamily ATPase
MISKELQQGKAAEHLVLADLLLQGYLAFLADQGSAYDVVLDHGHRLYRIQVKSTRQQRRCRVRGVACKPSGNACYVFALRSGRRALKPIDRATIDLFAFVALDTRTIAYVPAKEVPRQVWTAYKKPPRRWDQLKRIYDEVRLIDSFPIAPALERIPNVF